MAGPSQREVEAIVTARNEASQVFKRVAEDAKAAGNDINKSFNDANVALDRHGKEINKITQFYKNQRGEQRQQTFFYREGLGSINALSFGLMSLISTTSEGDKEQQKFNKSLAQGFAAFQGLDFLLAGMGAGPLGMAAAGVAGIATAVISATKETVDYNKLLKEQEEHLKNIINFYNTYENQLKGNATDNVKLSNEERRVLEAKREVLSQVINAQTKGEKDVQIIINDVGKTTAQVSAMEQAANEATGKTLEQNKKAYQDINDLLKVRQMAINTTTVKGKDLTPKALEEQAKEQARLDAEWFGGRLATQKAIDELADKSFKENYDKQIKEETDLNTVISQMEKQTYRNDRDYEMQVLNEWHDKVLASSTDFYVDLAAVDQIYRDRKSQFDNAALRKQVDEGAKLAQQAVGIFEQLSNQKYDTELNNIDYEKQQKLKAIDDELAKEKLSDEKKKELNAKRKAIEDQYAEKEKAVKQQQWQANKDYALTMAVINGAQAVTKAWAEMGPLGWVGAALTTAASVAQIAVINAQEMPKFAMGTPPGGFRVPGNVSSEGMPIIVHANENVNVTPAGRSQASSSGATNVTIHISTPMGKMEVIDLIKGVVRDTGETILQLTQDNRKNIILSSN